MVVDRERGLRTGRLTYRYGILRGQSMQLLMHYSAGEYEMVRRVNCSERISTNPSSFSPSAVAAVIAGIPVSPAKNTLARSAWL